MSAKDCVSLWAAAPSVPWLWPCRADPFAWSWCHWDSADCGGRLCGSWQESKHCSFSFTSVYVWCPYTNLLKQWVSSVAVHVKPTLMRVVLCVTKLLARVPVSFMYIMWQFMQSQHLLRWFCVQPSYWPEFQHLLRTFCGSLCKTSIYVGDFVCSQSTVQSFSIFYTHTFLGSSCKTSIYMVILCAAKVPARVPASLLLSHVPGSVAGMPNSLL